MKKKLFLLLVLVVSLATVLFALSNNSVEAKEVPTVYEVFTDYYNNGVYKKDTTIHLNENGVTDLAVHFHVENHLVRTTYYEVDALWMSRGDEKDGVDYSYYGTAYDEEGNSYGVTNGISNEPLVEPAKTSVVLKGKGKESMEAYYTTLHDLMKYDAEWTYQNGVYTSCDSQVLKYFLDFTAPCLYGSVINSNVFSYEKATAEINSNGDLVLKLWVHSTDYGYIDGGEDKVIDNAAVLSTAVIGHDHEYSLEYSYDEENHWHECRCGVVEDLEEHTFGKGVKYNDVTMIYTCTTCGYVHYDITSDDLTAGVDTNKFGLAIRMPEGRDIKIAQFADIHFGVDGKNWHNFNLDRIKAFIVDAVERDRPDLIVCSGDNVIGTGISSSNPNEHDLIEFIEFMEQFEIPWTFIYGNHDAETKNKKEYSDYLVSCVKNGTTKYLLYQEEYIEVADKSTSSNDLGRYGNYSVQLLDPTGEKLVGSIIMFDAGTYLYDQSIYQSITPGQVKWYEEKVATLQSIYSKQEGNLHDVIPTIVFSHIQLPEHKIAYHEAYYNQTPGYEFVLRQDSVADSFKDVSNQKPNTDSGLFDKLVEVGSTKAVFVGHAHSYGFQVMSHGILLGYAPNTGLSKMDGDCDLPRTIYTYNVSEDFSIKTTFTEEHPEEPNGLTYSYFGSDNETDRTLASYDKITGRYYVVLDMKLWAKVRLRYNGIILTPENTNVTGDYNKTNTTNKLYLGKAGNAFQNGTADDTYVLVYDPSTNNLDIRRLQGLTVSGTFNDTVSYDAANYEYKYTATLSQWNGVIFTHGETLITPSNTNVLGFYNKNNTNDGTVRLYIDNIPGKFILGHLTPVTYTFTYNLKENSLTITPAKVNGYDISGSKDGLVYTGTFTGKAIHNTTSNSYTFTLTLAQWKSVEMFYNGSIVEAFNSELVDLVNNTSLYAGTPKSKIVYGGATAQEFTFVYTPATSTTKAKLVISTSTSLTPDKTNADAGADSIAVWTGTGTKLKSGVDSTNAATIQSNYVGNGWRMYLIVDAEGRICYLVQNPVNGYGGYGSTSYYCHSYYDSGVNNPAFNKLAGWQAWQQGSGKHNLYELLVPEGGFAITAEGADRNAIYDILGITSTEDASVNKRGIISDDIRLYYDSINQKIVFVK